MESNLSCYEVNDNLSAFLDRELSREEIGDMSEHLLACETCRKNYESLKLTQIAVKKYFSQTSSAPEVSKKVMRRFNNTERHRRIFVSISAMIMLLLLSWFSANIIQPSIEKSSYTHNSDTIDPDKPIYVKSENFLITEAYYTPTKGALSFLYEN